MIDIKTLKKFFIFTMIGTLILSALVAVFTVLTGKFDDVTAKTLLTLFMVVIHSLLSFVFIWGDEKQNTYDRFKFFSNLFFVLLVFSFLTSVFNIWDVISGEVTIHLYQVYFLSILSAFHITLLSKALNKERYIDMFVMINYFFVGLVFLLLIPVVFFDSSYDILGEMFFRILGAVAIIDGTLSILVTIFYKMYVHKNRAILEAESSISPSTEKKGFSIWVWILIIFLVLQIIPFIFELSRFSK